MPELRTKAKRMLLSGGLVLFFCLFRCFAFASNELVISSAAASSSTGSYTAAKAIDKNYSTCWKGANSKSYWWLRLDLGKAYSLAKVSVWWDKNYGSINYNIQASNDSLNWVNLYTLLSSAGASQNPVQKDYNLSGLYRYLRIYINKAQKNFPVIYEIKLFGEAPDTTPPTGTIKINNDEPYVNSPKVTLSLLAQDNPGGSGLAQMQFSNDNSNWSSPEAYAAIKNWTLTAQDGAKTVYVKFKDAAGNTSVAYSDTTILDTTPPQITSTYPADGLRLYSNEAIYVSAQVSDLDPSPLEYQFSIDNTVKQAWSSQNSFRWVPAFGVHKIKFEVRDIGAGNAREVEVCVFQKPVSAPNP